MSHQVPTVTQSLSGKLRTLDHKYLRTVEPWLPVAVWGLRLELRVQRKQCRVGLREGGEERSSEGVYGPGITKETKSEATMVFTSCLNTSTEVLSHSTVRRCVSGLEMG
jgi:hypothetical protein